MNSFEFIIDSFFLRHISAPIAVISAIVVLIIIITSVAAAKEIKKIKTEKDGGARDV